MRIITPNDGYQYFFGYYDLQPLDSTQRYHLTHRVKFLDRIPTAEDLAELGVIDMQTGEFIKYSETTAWNFQQGAMLRWYRDDDHIVYNVFDGEAFRTEVMNIKTGEKRRYPKAFADMAQDGSHAVCINFSRIYDFRPGYGYCQLPDPFADQYAPEDDGVFIMDMETGACRLAVNYRQIKEAFPEAPYCNEKLLVNHITLNPSGTRFLMLIRNMTASEGGKWKTLMATSDLDGNLYQLTDYAVNSHYHWKNDREIVMFYGTVCTGGSDNNCAMHLFEDLTRNVTRLPEPNDPRDLHCIYSPDRRYIMGDDYPHRGKFARTLWLFDTQTNVCYRAGDFDILLPNDLESALTDTRCDLHARWSRDGKFITLDTMCTKSRTIVTMTLDEMLQGTQFTKWEFPRMGRVEEEDTLINETNIFR